MCHSIQTPSAVHVVASKTFLINTQGVSEEGLLRNTDNGTTILVSLVSPST